jgi:hypothetical protein
MKKKKPAAKSKKAKELKSARKPAEGKPVKLDPEVKLKNSWGSTEKNSYPGINGSEDLLVP